MFTYVSLASNGRFQMQSILSAPVSAGRVHLLPRSAFDTLQKKWTAMMVDAVRNSLSWARIVLVETSHPGNIGAAARAMKTMGLSQLYLVSPRRFPCAEATARAAGADDLLAAAIVVSDLEAAIADCATVVGTSARSRHVAWPSVEAANCSELAGGESGARVAFVFGRENSGLTNDELDRCNALLTIPTDPHYQSLNLAAAVQILAYELRKAALAQAVQTAPVAPFQGESAQDSLGSAKELAGFYEHLRNALIHVGYLNPATPGLLMRRLRRLFSRSGLSRSEINLLRGILAAAERLQRVERQLD